MADELEDFKKKMLNDSKARAQFVADTKAAPQKQGVDVNDPDVLKKFGLHDDQVAAGGQFKPHSLSTVVVTVTE